MSLRSMLGALLILIVWLPAAQADPLAVRPGELLRGRFVHERHLQGFSRPLVSEGRFVLAPGQGLIWQVSSPLLVTSAVTPSGVLQQAAGTSPIRLPVLPGQATSSLFSMLEGALSGDLSALENHFDATRGTNLLELRPRPNAGPAGFPVESVTIHFDHYVEMVEIHKPSGDFERILFSDQEAAAGPLEPAESTLLRSVSP